MEIEPINYLEGKIESSPSKSYSHRAFALALHANSSTLIVNPLTTGDVNVTVEFCKSLGALVQKTSKQEIESDAEFFKTHPHLEVGFSQTKFKDILYLVIPPLKRIAPTGIIDTKNSGTTIRIFSALCGLYEGNTKLSGIFFERSRPMQPLLDALMSLGIENASLSEVNGVEIIPKHPCASKVEIAGDVSSQFITGLLCLASKLPIQHDVEKTKIELTTPAKSYPYLQITEEIMEDFSISFEKEFDAQFQGYYEVPADQNYSGIIYRVPGDFSSAAFIIVAAALNPFPYEITIRNLNLDSPQGDKRIIEILQKIGANIKEVDNDTKSAQSILITGGKMLHGFNYDCSQTPDLFPILCVLGLLSDGQTLIHNAEHVRIKETDRIAVMVRELRKMGAVIEERKDGVFIEGPQSLRGIDIVHDNDHRIAMALYIACLFARSDSTISNAEIIADSYPRFLDDIEELRTEKPRPRKKYH